MRESKPVFTSAKQVPKLQPQLQRETTPQNLTLNEPIASPFDVVLSTSCELPAVDSTGWQLMYPAGGSTHPAYPWPPADPRLTFHAHLVPLLNGLPDVAQAPKLKLPLGWRHLSWAGLHPIAFDPHQQLFKLTPVGPLPLTSEELHQGGLQEYAPGGRLHPEYGLLPIMSTIGDGSDYEVFNFEGIDWTLPWAECHDILPIEASTPLKTDIEVDFHVSPIVLAPSHYLEARDCPDGIIDLEEGWRWLSGREESPLFTFTATPGKIWRGTGVRRTSRKYKAPIASMMANAMAEKQEDNPERYLLNQDTREFDAFKSVATPVHINIALMLDVEFTLVEFLSYFPHHYQWRKGGDRLVRSGMGASDIANFVNMSRRLPGTAVCSNSSVNDHAFWTKLEEGMKVKVKPFKHGICSYTAENWAYDVWKLTDYPLLALAHGLVELPSGLDAGPLTALIQWCRNNKRYKAMLSEVPVLLEEAGIESLIEPGNGVDPDQQVLARHIEAIKKDRLRVLKEIREKKELDAVKEEKEIEAAKEKKSKRRKLE